MSLCENLHTTVSEMSKCTKTPGYPLTTQKGILERRLLANHDGLGRLAEACKSRIANKVTDQTNQVWEKRNQDYEYVIPLLEKVQWTIRIEKYQHETSNTQQQEGQESQPSNHELINMAMTSCHTGQEDTKLAQTKADGSGSNHEQHMPEQTSSQNAFQIAKTQSSEAWTQQKVKEKADKVKERHNLCPVCQQHHSLPHVFPWGKIPRPSTKLVACP